MKARSGAWIVRKAKTDRRDIGEADAPEMGRETGRSHI